MISAPQLALTRPEACLINCVRGPLVKEFDLVTALKNGQIRGAAPGALHFDVVSGRICGPGGQGSTRQTTRCN